MNPNDKSLLKKGSIPNIIQNVLTVEGKALLDLFDSLGPQLEDTVRALLNNRGKVIVCGMGKSGLIGRKIAATFSSTGTPSYFLHPAEAFHGDLGVVTQEDILLCLSYSGETNELLEIIPFLKDNGNLIVAITGNQHSTLAKNANFHLLINIEREACPLKLAPTTSTTTMLALGDALAIALMELRGFQSENFARFHPHGSLGKRLLSKVEDVMQTTLLPLVSADTAVSEIIHTISKGRVGLAIVVDKKGKVIGIITDGDVRRAMEDQSKDFLSLNSEDLMTTQPKTIAKQEKLIIAQQLMMRHKITSLIVCDQQIPIGVIQIYDIAL